MSGRFEVFGKSIDGRRKSKTSGGTQRNAIA